jgi:hypothetical protein
MPPPTVTVWITRERVTVKHIRGLLEGLEGEQALDYSEVRILVVSDDAAVTTPWGVFTVDTLPPQGLLFVSDDG